MPLILDLMPLEEKPPEAPTPKTIVVRYGYLKQIGEFASELATKVGCGSKLVCRTERGTEIGELLTTTCSNGGCGKSVTREKMLEYIDNSGGSEYPFSSEGRILRVATLQDLAEQEKLDANRKKDINQARELVLQYHLQMKIVDVEYLLGKERVIFYFTSEHRIDFRQLVRDLAHHIHARIELRQIGARDEARITADYEKCGQHCCCKQFLKVLTPISMRSAKIQKATLDPAKISGRCGRLMCCLRYEDQTYEELRKKLPKRNTRVKTAEGEAWVVDGQILTQLVLVQHDDGKRSAVPMELIQAFDLPRPKLANGQTMQSPNDRLPEGYQVDPQRAPGGPPQQNMPRREPNAPLAGPPSAPNVASAPNAPAQRPPQNPAPRPNPQSSQPNRNVSPKNPQIPRPPQAKLPPRPPDRAGNPNAQTQRPPQQNQPRPAPPQDDLDDLIADAMDAAPRAASTPPTPAITPPPPAAIEPEAQIPPINPEQSPPAPESPQ